MRGAVAAVLIGIAAIGSVSGASAAVHKTQLQSVDFPDPTFRTVTVRTVIDPGDQVKPHTHPGLEMAYVISGKGRLMRAGAPQRLLNAGDSFSMPEGTVHSVTNVGHSPLTIVSTYVVNRNKPLASPAPAGH